jgi:hypothetical protein
LRASTFLLGHWFEVKKDEVLGSKDVCVKSAKICSTRPNADIRIMSIRQIEHISFTNFIHLWNWSSTVYNQLYVSPEDEAIGDFAIDVYHDDRNPYEAHLGSVQVVNFSSTYDELHADFRAAAPLLGKALMTMRDPDGRISIESLLDED